MMQRIAVFNLPDAPLTEDRLASAWRARFVGQQIGTYDNWNQLRVVSLRDRLWIIPANPRAGDWLLEHIDPIAGAVSDAVGAPVPLELRERAVGVRHADDLLWGYRLPTVVVEKSAPSWAPHFEPVISPALRDGMARRFERSLRAELRAWDRLPESLDNDEPFFVVSSPGQAYGVPAITPDRSGHGKPISVLARRHLWLLSYWRFEGEIFLGPLASLGFGRTLRCQPPEMLDRYTQKALLALPSSTKELRA